MRIRHHLHHQVADIHVVEERRPPLLVPHNDPTVMRLAHCRHNLPDGHALIEDHVLNRLRARCKEREVGRHRLRRVPALHHGHRRGQRHQSPVGPVGAVGAWGSGSLRGQRWRRQGRCADVLKGIFDGRHHRGDELDVRQDLLTTAHRVPEASQLRHSVLGAPGRQDLQECLQVHVAPELVGVEEVESGAELQELVPWQAGR
mmetsp:Transcript_35807/g.92108  ORF Transcript_35807/g.92108 Transcript_35807/m.92108 type:complete len:202 (-) Transcript_35807:1844-2449(-)